MIEAKLEISPTPAQVAELIWEMGSDEQAEMFSHLLDAAGSEHMLMMQFLSTRQECESRDDNSLAAFQVMFSSCYKYINAD